MASKASKPIGLKVVLGIIGLEQIVVLYLLSSYVIATLAGQVKSLPTMLALAGLGLIVAVWLAYVFKGLYAGRRWARSGAIFWQLVQLTVAWGSFTGQFANAAIGFGLIVPSVAVIALLFTKPVFDSTQGELESD
jgi:hypothetical protein